MTPLTIQEIDRLIEILTKHEQAINFSLPMVEQLSALSTGDDSLAHAVKKMRAEKEENPEVFARIKVKLYDMKEELQNAAIYDAFKDKPVLSPHGFEPFTWQVVFNTAELHSLQCVDVSGKIVGAVWKNHIHDCWYGRNWSNREHRYESEAVAKQEVERCAREGSIV